MVWDESGFSEFCLASGLCLAGKEQWTAYAFSAVLTSPQRTLSSVADGLRDCQWFCLGCARSYLGLGGGTMPESMKECSGKKDST